MARGKKTSPSALKRKARRAQEALDRIQQDAGERQELWVKGEAAKAHRGSRVPVASQVSTLTADLDEDFDDRRFEQKGQMEPGRPKTSGAFRS